MADYLNVDEAIEFLKNGFVLIDENPNSFYFMKADRLVNYRNGSRYTLSLDDFYDLFTSHHFVLNLNQSGIDETKDIEYYSFKHK